MNAVFSQRLKNARIMNGLSMDELCKRMNNIVSKQSIHKYESGKMMPDSTILIALSNALNTKIDYFFRPLSVSLGNIEFRKKAKLPIRELSAIKELVKDKVERYIEIEEICNLSSDFTTDFSSFTIYNENDIFSITTQLKKEWNLGEDGINNLIEIFEEHQIKIIEIDAVASFDGLCAKLNDSKPVIVLNKSFDIERKRFTALHELGHILLHFDSEINSKEKEKLCHLFANEMLISRDVFINKIGSSRKDISLMELRDIQSQFGISIDALMIKAKYLKIISESRYTYYCISKNRNANFKKEVNKSVAKAEYSNRFERLVYRALASDLITLSKASVLLNVPLAEVRDNLNLV